MAATSGLTIPRTFATTNRFLGRCNECILPVAREIEWQGNFQRVKCPECARPVQLKRITAQVDLELACDASCMSATRDICECSCGGANHGSSWLGLTAASLAANLELEVYRSRITKLRAPRRAAA